MNQKKSIIVLLSISLLLSVNLQAVYAQNLDALNDYSVKLAITPNHLEHVLGEHKVGYFFVLSKHGVPITSSYDVAVSVSSDDPSIVSVPPKIVLKANEEFVSFPLNVGEKTGKTTITATLNGKTTFQKIEVGTDKTYLPDELSLSLNIPTDEMHVNSEMPFSVFLKTPNNVLVRAPHDIEIKLEFEEQLDSTNSDFLIIEKGDYYTWVFLLPMKKLEICSYVQFTKNLGWMLRKVSISLQLYLLLYNYPFFPK